MCRFCKQSVQKVEEMSVLVKYGGGFVIAVFLLLMAVVTIGLVGDLVSSPPPDPATAMANAATEHRRIRTRSAKLAALQLALNNAKAPSQLKEISSDVIANDEKMDLVMVHEVYDAPNAFGVMLRQSACAAVSVTDDDSHFESNEEWGFMKCSNPPGDQEIITMKVYNHWPMTNAEAGRLLKPK